MLKKIIRFLNNILLRLESKQLVLNIEKANSNRNRDIAAMQKLWRSLQERKVNKYDEFFNVCIYAAIVGKDIMFLSKNYLILRSRDEQNLNGRLLSLTIIEFLEGINGLLGKNLRDELNGNNLTQYIDSLNTIHKQLAKIKKDNNQLLRKIRNNAAAHITKNAKDLMIFTTKIEIDNLSEIASKTLRLNKELTVWSIQILNEITKELEEQVKELKNKTAYNKTSIAPSQSLRRLR